ncbi:MAG: glycosyltransferase family 2 protein [Clostridiales bacterium]|nr:glycosyltransferase family 2 protein [Clostridiales bacterium]
MEKILTVTVPAYNAEKYLRDCLDSLCVEEVLPLLDILVIDDGSTDSTARIAGEYAARYPQSVRVILKENGGHGSGINMGIREARGTYFKVVDSDDWVDWDGFLRLVRVLEHQNADIVYSGFLWAYDRGEPERSMFETEAEIPIPFQGVQYGKVYCFDDIADRLYVKMHSLTIRTEILREHAVAVDEHCFYVDTEYIIYPIPYVETIEFLPEFVYYYRIGSSGQSVGMERMRRNEGHYRTVLRSCLQFYGRLGRQIACTEPKRRYIAGIIARAVAGRYKILLSLPPSAHARRRLISFDQKLKARYPEVYRANINPAVKSLRLTGYLIWPLVHVMVRRKYQ